jgi:hypothetical protein
MSKYETGCGADGRGEPCNLVVLGPSGVGKSPLGAALKTDLEIEPHRVRRRPRRYPSETQEDDRYYMSEMAYHGLCRLLTAWTKVTGPLGGETKIIVYEHVITFQVRGKPHVLFIPESENVGRCKIEIYGPVLKELLQGRLVDPLFKGETFVVLLNPWDQPLADITPASASNPQAAEGQVLCKLLKERGETDEGEIQERVSRVGEELKAWKSIASLSQPGLHVLEAKKWEQTESAYSPDRAGCERRAKDRLVGLARKVLPEPQVKLFQSFFG